ncbi:AEC family transporter [Marinomonas ostreistagni]|uniref:AEC family transporter n=1 Tax=Marinomonas ostreistagni TaxID=359209 RepID=UPI00194ECA1C|nr:AEC family transporter [Marinomonas ostreistagni]MBM6551180.1 AEC family transporter [Marinomonas ostreistagni]
MTVFTAILPVFLLLLMGALLQRQRFPFEGFWQGVDKLVYWCLFPALLFTKTSVIDFSNPMLSRYAMTLVGAMACTALFVFVLARVIKQPNPTITSMVQAGVRFNTFVALGFAERLFGTEGLALAVLGAAVLIPSINIFLVIFMVTMHGDKEVSLPKLVSKELVKNPLIMSIVCGISLNLLGLTPIPIVSEMVEMLSRATLPLVLLAVGAGVRLTTIRGVGLPFWISSAGRFLVFPAGILLACHLLGISGLAAYVALLFGLVPTAPSGYALARQLGGDAERIAVFITLQTAMSLVTVPVSMALAQRWLG